MSDKPVKVPTPAERAAERILRESKAGGCICAACEERIAAIIAEEYAPVAEALEPFAAYAARLTGPNAVGDPCEVIADPSIVGVNSILRVEHLRAAAAALALVRGDK